jgi:hypothetical protein
VSRNDLTELDAKARAVVLLARGTNSDKVGETVGVSGRTVRRWTEQPEFKAEVDAARRALLDEAVRALAAASRDAIATLHAALTDASPNVRVRAASVLLSSLPSLTEHLELDARIAALETALDPERNAA